jgi:hypothetical protein
MDHAGTLKLTRRAFIGAACLGLLPRPLFASAPMVKHQAPGFYRLMVGAFEVTALSDGTGPMPALRLLQGSPTRLAETLSRNWLGTDVETSHNAYLVNTGTKLVLIDAGAGTLLGPRTGQLVDNLQAAGYQPEQVDEIYLTHLHPDHIGGLMRGDQRAFPNAIVRADKREVEYWLSETNMRSATDMAKRFFEAAATCLPPYLKAVRWRNRTRSRHSGPARLRPHAGPYDVHGRERGQKAGAVGRYRARSRCAILRSDRHHRV